jgi:hypothetical protein
MYSKENYQKYKVRINAANKVYADKNRDRINTYAKEYRAKNKDKQKNYDLVKLYGITANDYDDLLKKQNGVCAICEKPETAVIRNKRVRLAVDHDHTKGIIRGLLCMMCNHGIGRFKDDIKILQRAIDYLNKEIV